MGIRRNTHMLMMDKNSDQVTALINDWMVMKDLSAE